MNVKEAMEYLKKSHIRKDVVEYLEQYIKTAAEIEGSYYVILHALNSRPKTEFKGIFAKFKREGYNQARKELRESIENLMNEERALLNVSYVSDNASGRSYMAVIDSTTENLRMTRSFKHKEADLIYGLLAGKITIDIFIKKV